MEVLHSKIIGQGKPLLILHGFLGMSDNWKTPGTQLSKQGYQVHLMDQRNHGKSFHAPNFDYELLCKDVVHYMQHHHIEAAYVLGHSMGGKTAMQLATSHPQLVTKLVVADIAPKYYPPHHQHILEALAQLDFNRISSRKEADEALSQYLPEVGLRQFLLKSLYWIQPGKLGFRFNLKVLHLKMEEIGENISPTARYDGATLFLRGDESGYITPHDIPVIKKHFPHALIETIDHAGHWLHAENTEQFIEKTLRFLNS